MVENSTGRVITAMHNNVIRSLPQKPNESFTWDPTAHGERQLVNWYYANRESLALPRPARLLRWSGEPGDRRRMRLPVHPEP